MSPLPLPRVTVLVLPVVTKSMPLPSAIFVFAPAVAVSCRCPARQCGRTRPPPICAVAHRHVTVCATRNAVGPVASPNGIVDTSDHLVLTISEGDRVVRPSRNDICPIAGGDCGVACLTVNDAGTIADIEVAAG